MGKTRTNTVVSVLLISPIEEDHLSLGRIFNRVSWKLHTGRTLQEARKILNEVRVGVVISECCLSEGCGWREVLSETATLAAPPPRVIVTDRLADERLWAEVLNLGGYDLFMKPFDAHEILRVVSLGWLSWKRDCEEMNGASKLVRSGASVS